MLGVELGSRYFLISSPTKVSPPSIDPFIRCFGADRLGRAAGMVVEWGAVTNTGTVTPRGVRIAFWVLLAIPVAIYSVAVMRMLAVKLRTREQLDELDEKMVELEETDPDSKLDEAYDESYCSSRT